MGINLDVAPSTGFDGNLLILAANSTDVDGYPTELPGVDDLAGADWVDVTYSFTADGWTEGASEETVTDDRLTLASVLAQPGKVTESLTVKYVFTNTTADIADPLFVKGDNIIFAVRRAVPHSQAIATGDKFDFLEVKCGVKQNDAPAANANFTRTQVMYPQSPSVRDHAIAA